MEEQLEDQSQEGFHLSEYIDLVRRRRWLLLIPRFSVWVLVWLRHGSCRRFIGQAH